MKSKHVILCSILAVLPFLSGAQDFKDYREAKQALDHACAEKDLVQAKALYATTRKLAGENEWQKSETTMRLVQTLTNMGESQSVLDFGLPVVTSCTNFSLAPWPVRNIFYHTARAALAEGKMEIFKKQVDALAKEKVTPHSFNCWLDAARLLVDDAVSQRKKKSGNSAEEFRVGGSTFGLWQVPLDIKGRSSMSQLRLAEAENLLTKVMPQEDLTQEQRLRVDEMILDGQLRAGDDAGQRDAIKRIHDLVASFHPADVNGTNLMERAITKLFRFHEERMEWAEGIALADRLAASRSDYFGKDSPALEARRLVYHSRAGDDAAYRKGAAVFARRPMTPALMDGYLIGAEAIKFKPLNWPESRLQTARFLQPAYRDRMAVDEERRMKLLEALTDASFVSHDVPTMRSLFAEMKEIHEKRQALIDEDVRKEKEARAQKKPYPRNRPPRLVPAGWIYQKYGMEMMTEHVPSEAVYAFSRQFESQGWNASCQLWLAAARLAAGREKECVDGLSAFVTNANFQIVPRTAGKIIRARVLAKDEAEFKSLVRSTCLGGDVEKDFLGALQASKYLLEAGARPDQIGYLLALQEVIEGMKHPERKVVYTARYLPDAPRSADGALRTGLFEKRPEGDFFYPYATYSSIEREKARKLLKDNPPPVLVNPDPAKGGRLAVAYDSTGVHLYLKLDDPKAIDTLDGLNDGGGFEITVMPGEMTRYNQFFGNARDPENKQQVEWDSCQIGRKLTRDYIVTDSTVTKDAYVFHSFIPWVMYYTRLPENGSTWRFVICCSWAGQFRSAGGGSVHELGRGLQVTFDIPPAARDAIRAGVVRGAVGEYRRVRAKWENAEFWADPHIGDPAFFDKVVRPLLDDLDAQAKVASGDKLSKADVDRFFKNYLTKWIDFRLALDGLRADYLEDKFFEE